MPRGQRVPTTTHSVGSSHRVRALPRTLARQRGPARRLCAQCRRSEEDSEGGEGDEAAQHQRQRAVRGNRLDDSVGVRDGYDYLRESRPQVPGRVREVEVDEGSTVEIEEKRGAAPEKPGEAGEDHEGADTRLRPAVGGDNATGNARAADKQIRGRQRGPERVVVERPLDCEPEADSDRQERQSEQTRQHHPAAAASASPESSLLGMKLQPGFPSSRQRTVAALRLEVSTIAGGGSASESRSATAKPSRSGSCTSSSTISGCSSVTAASAEAPSAASPTTSKPAAWSSARAADRNAAWSSTISTVCRMP